MNRKHILVIGAGAAGLMAARELLKKNHKVTVLEARARTGGRIHTIHEGFSIPTEAGAEFIHGNQPVTMNLLNEAGIRFARVEGDFVSAKNGKLAQDNSRSDQWDLMLEKLKHLKDDETLASFLKRHFDPLQYPDLYKEVTGFVEGYDAADINKVSALALREEWLTSNDEDQYRVEGGYGLLIDFLEATVRSSGTDVFLSTVVNKISWNHGRVTVDSNDGRHWTADRILITAPIGVLQHGAIVFDPPLPTQYTDAFHDIGFGSVTKFLIEFRAGFWEKVVLASGRNTAFIFSNAEVPTWWTQSPSPAPLLTGWQGGPSVFKENRDREVQLAKAVRSLAAIFSCSPYAVEANVVKAEITNWTDDPFSLGAYGYPMVKSKQARDILTTPVGDTIWFAGEGLYDGPAVGTVEAALHSAQTVAAVL